MLDMFIEVDNNIVHKSNLGIYVTDDSISLTVNCIKYKKLIYKANVLNEETKRIKDEYIKKFIKILSYNFNKIEMYEKKLIYEIENGI